MTCRGSWLISIHMGSMGVRILVRAGALGAYGGDAGGIARTVVRGHWHRG
ncbi:hypothetical protein GCM10010872_38780 [Dyella flava]|nr:hypothetical protein GCM10010872_38780 [Dyella flava]